MIASPVLHSSLIIRLLTVALAGPHISVILTYNTDDQGTKKSGIVEVDEHGRVTAFLEKPGPDATKFVSQLICLSY